MSEIEDLDIDGYMMVEGVCIVEWAEKGEAFLPEGHISVALYRITENGSAAVDKRSIRLTGPKGRGLSDLKL
jgi:tRNA A37 threonylcarbamoyladenosine biosynthesis protein TsaE